MIWFIGSIFFAFFNSVTMLINQHFKLDGHLISAMRGIGVGLLYSPALFFVEFPTNPIFWSLIILEAFISSIFNERLYASSAKYGASSTSIIMVLSIGIGMIFWWIIDYERFIGLINDLPILCGILVSLALTVLGFYILVKKSLNMFSIAELKYMSLVVILLAAMMINRKEIMMHELFAPAIVYYCVVAIFLSGVVNLIIYLKKERKFSPSKMSKSFVIKSGVFMTIASSITIFCGNVASLYTPNPAYINAIGLSTPIWIILINKFMGKKEYINYFGLTLLIIAMGLLIYFGNVPINTAYYHIGK